MNLFSATGSRVAPSVPEVTTTSQPVRLLWSFFILILTGNHLAPFTVLSAHAHAPCLTGNLRYCLKVMFVWCWLFLFWTPNKYHLLSLSNFLHPLHSCLRLLNYMKSLTEYHPLRWETLPKTLPVTGYSSWTALNLLDHLSSFNVKILKATHDNAT